MPDITISPRTRDRLADFGAAWGISEDAVITRLLDAFTAGSNPDDGDRVPVHALYLGVHAEGVYRRSTGRIQITSGPGAGVAELKPSPAATVVIKAVQAERGNSVRGGSRNGWDFWTITATGQPLRTIRPAR